MLNPALAAATAGVSAWRKLMYSLVWQSVMWRPGKLRFLIGVKNPLPIRPAVTARKHGPLAGPRRSPDSRLQSGYALLSSRIRRQLLILIDASFSSRLSRSSRPNHPYGSGGLMSVATFNRHNGLGAGVIDRPTAAWPARP